jgi:hypothetical protein
MQQRQCCTEVNILRLLVEYLNATVKSKTQYADLEIATNKSSQTRKPCRQMGTGTGLAYQVALGWVFG